jgi:hypothetical protein
MSFLTVDDCLSLGGAKRVLLREFDHLLRDALIATRHAARKLDGNDQVTESACLTIMMSVVASAALASAANSRDVTDESFTAAARDALVWAKRNPNILEDTRALWLWSLFCPPTGLPDTGHL